MLLVWTVWQTEINLASLKEHLSSLTFTFQETREDPFWDICHAPPPHCFCELDCLLPDRCGSSSFIQRSCPHAITLLCMPILFLNPITRHIKSIRDSLYYRASTKVQTHLENYWGIMITMIRWLWVITQRGQGYILGHCCISHFPWKHLGDFFLLLLTKRPILTSNM